ncbi:MAG: hypothetical protein ACHP8A_00540 [Terriglobales bacterium]|jgi:hypothetical protein|nr:hypothetical protein [Terriglobales bacterium]
MRISRGLAALFLLLVFSSLMFAADLTGKWSGPMQDGRAVFTLKSDNNVITGTMLGIDGKEYPITDGKLDGENISFTVNSQWQGNPVKLLVKGTVSGEQMKLKIAADNGYWSTDATVQRESKK